MHSERSMLEGLSRGDSRGSEREGGGGGGGGDGSDGSE